MASRRRGLHAQLQEAQRRRPSRGCESDHDACKIACFNAVICPMSGSPVGRRLLHGRPGNANPPRPIANHPGVATSFDMSLFFPLQRARATVQIGHRLDRYGRYRIGNRRACGFPLAPPRRGREPKNGEDERMNPTRLVLSGAVETAPETSPAGQRLGGDMNPWPCLVTRWLASSSPTLWRLATAAALCIWLAIIAMSSGLTSDNIHVGC